jgi:hypothetical protein
MAEKTADPAPQADENWQSEYLRGGKGRKDDVGGSGVLPASETDVPADAENRKKAGFVGDMDLQQNPPEEEP